MELARPGTADKQFSCDTIVAMSEEGRPRMVFGKNSDRPLDEAQPLASVPRQTHPAGAHVRCQYLTIPQVLETYAVLGSRPWWMWGYEQGVNEHGVVIGNEAIYTRDDVPEVGLTGMDLVRLGLERGATAAQAQETIVVLLEEHGQGGDCVYLVPRRYHNSFIVADGREAFVLETSGRRWVSKRLGRSTAIANLVTIGDDWDTCSDSLESYARSKHWWWGPPGRKLDFRSAYEDSSVREKTEPRYQASCRFLASPDSCSIQRVMRHLRDHYEGGTVQVPEMPGRPRPYSVCVHPGRFASATAASMVVELLPENPSAPIAWCSMSPPCTSMFLPIRVGSQLPAPLTIGSNVDDLRSVWWTLHRLARFVELDPTALAPQVQEVWSEYETELVEAVASDPSALPELDVLVDELVQRATGLLELLDDRALAV
jgi:secernin